MESNELPSPPVLNTHSIISLILAILTLISLCVGLAPLPFTGFVCFPVSLLLGILALILGFVALHRIKKHDQTGHGMAWTGILIGGLVFLCILCLMLAFISVIVFAPGAIPTHPLINKYL
jgi:hypothetical protein